MRLASSVVLSIEQWEPQIPAPCFWIVGVGLLLHPRAQHDNIGKLAMCQVFRRFGGSFAVTCIQVVAQAAVSHADVATVTAIPLQCCLRAHQFLFRLLEEQC